MPAFSLLVGIGNDVYVQVTDVIQVLSDAFSVGSLPEYLPLLAQIERGRCLYTESGDGMSLVAQCTGVGHAADKAAHAKVALAVPAVLCIGSEVRHTLLCYVKFAIGCTVYRGHFNGSVETEVFQSFVGVCHLGGTIESCSVGTLEIDGGRQCTQVHETAVGVAHRYITKRHVSVAQLETFVGTVPEVSGCVHDEVTENFGMPHQFQENGGSAGVHLELVPDFTSVRDVGGNEVDVVNDAAEIILCRSAYITADAQSKLAFSVCQQEARGLRLMDVGQLRLVHDTDNFVARLVYGNQYDTFGRLILNNHFFCAWAANVDRPVPHSRNITFKIVFI